MNAPVPPPPRTTYSQMLKAKVVETKIKERREIAEKKDKEEKERLRKQREMNAAVTKVLRMAKLEAKGDYVYKSERLPPPCDTEEQCKATLQATNKSRLVEHVKKNR